MTLDILPGFWQACGARERLGLRGGQGSEGEEAEMSDTPRVDVLCDPYWHDLLVHESRKMERELAAVSRAGRDLADVPRQLVNSRLEGWSEGWSAGMEYAARLCDTDEVCEGSAFAKAIRAHLPATAAAPPPAAPCSAPAER